jgi:hypothetical protein
LTRAESRDDLPFARFVGYEFGLIILGLLIRDDVNLLPAHERDHSPPLSDPVGNIVPYYGYPHY